MKHYSFLHEQLSGLNRNKFMGIGTAIGLAGGVLSGALKDQRTVIYDLEFKYKQTGNEKYKVAADRIRSMPQASFRKAMILKHGTVGTMSGLAAGTAAGTLSDRGYTGYSLVDREMPKVSNQTPGFQFDPVNGFTKAKERLLIKA